MAQTAGGVLRRGSDRVIAGVCSGLAQYLGIDPVFVRLVFVLLGIFNGMGILIYLVLWLVMEPATAPAAGGATLSQRLRTMGDEIREDFRTGFSHAPAATAPDAAAPSGEANQPSRPENPAVTRHRGLWIGGILVALGAYLLLSNLGYLSWLQWSVFWPVVLIAFGLFLLLRQRR
jgi:phage shock protein PspC (stress-responsive transcriptional regulator)